MSTPSVQAGWYPAPDGSGQQWWWDGTQWTQPGRDPQASKTITTLGLVTRILVLVAAASALVVIGTKALGISALTSFVNGSYDAIETINTYDTLTIVTTILHAAALLAAGIVWAIWQFRVANQATQHLRRTPGMHAWSWFIPVVSYWFPLQNISDLWKGTGRARPGWFVAWWTLWIANSVALSIAFRMNQQATIPAHLLAGMWVSVLAAVCLLAATPFAWRIVRDITRSYT